MNGRDMPVDGREMEALIAYVRYLGQGTAGAASGWRAWA